MLDSMLLNEPLVPFCKTPLIDLHQCSEYFYTTWCAEHPGQKPDVNFDYLAQRNNAVDSGRTKLRACILLPEVKVALASSTVGRPDESSLPPPANMAKIEEKDVDMEAASCPAASSAV